MVLIASLLVPVPSDAGPPRPYRKARSFSADVVTLVDDLGRYVVLVDSDRNGTVEHAILYEADEPLSPSAPRFQADARLVYAGDDGPRRVEVSHMRAAQPRQYVVQIDLDATDERDTPSHGKSSLHGGIALAVVSGFSLWPDAEGTDPEVLRRRGLPTFDEAETEHLPTSRAADPLAQAQAEACSCKECTAGGAGAGSCTVKCSGRLFVVDFGEDCSVQCGRGYYACCSCKGLFAAFGSCECVAN